MISCDAPCSGHVFPVVGQGTDKGDRTLSFQRQQVPLVLKQHETLCSDVACFLSMGRSEYLCRGPLGIAVSEWIIEESQFVLGHQYVPACFVDAGFRHLFLFQGFFKRREKSFPYHVHVQPGIQGEGGYLLKVAHAMVCHFIDGCVIRHHKSLEFPLPAKYIGQQPAVACGRDPVDLVERAHHAADPFIHCGLVRREVLVVHPDPAHVGGVVVSACLCGTIECEMLHRGHHRTGQREILALVAADQRPRDGGTQVGIFPAAFRSPSPARVTGDVGHG